MMRGQRGQTAVEYMGVLLVVAAITGVLATSDLGRVLRDNVAAVVCRIADTDDCRDKPSSKRDRDGDGISNAAEKRAGLNPDKADTDNDGIPDRRELELGTDPTLADSDRDGIDDRRERAEKLDPTKPDTDGDGLTDGEEAVVGTNPAEADSDGFDTHGDGLTDAEELALGTDPNHHDSDRDGWPDGYEADRGDDPTSDDRPFYEKAGEEILNNPFDYLLPTGAAAKYLSKGLIAKTKAAVRALREAKTLGQLAKARRDLLAAFRERIRRTPKPDAAEEAQRRQLLERLSRTLDHRKRELQRKQRADELEFDPDTGHARRLEAEDAAWLEELGVMRKPVRRADPKNRPGDAGADFVDANNVKWDHKQAITPPSGKPFNVTRYVDNLEQGEFSTGIRVVINEDKLAAADRAALRRELERRGHSGKVYFIPR